MSDIVEQAKKFMGRGFEKLTAEDKLIVGKALLIGRKKNPANPDFGAWRKENGFGALNRMLLRDLLWLAENEHFLYYTEYYLKEGIQVARKAWMAENGKDKTHRERVIEVLEQLPEEECLTGKEIQAELPDVPSVPRVLTPLVDQGRIVRPFRNQYRLPNEQEKEEHQAEQAKSEGTRRDNVFDASHGILTIFNKVTKWIQQRGTSRPWPRSGEKYVSGSVFETMTCVAETWKLAITRKPAKDEVIDGDKIAGWAPGYRLRIVVDPVWVPVNTHWESLSKYHKPRKETEPKK